jgi:hypothetical protein
MSGLDKIPSLNGPGFNYTELLFLIFDLPAPTVVTADQRLKP